MGLLLVIVLICLFICSPVFRSALFTFPLGIGYCLIDTYKYFKYKQWRNCKTGELICFAGLFGFGKTLSAVHRVVKLFKKYDGKRVYDKFRKKWVTQKVRIISNVELLTVPFEPFTSMQQIVDVTTTQKVIDEKNDTLTCVLFLGDEFSTQLNSREFKKNFNAYLLNAILTCRHHHISLFYTSQRFSLVDALLRSVTLYVCDCRKVWRYEKNYRYDAFEMENATNVMLLKPYKRNVWFIRNSDFDSYNTLACVDNLVKDCVEGKTITDKEILEMRGDNVVGPDSITRPSRKLRKIRKAGA